MNTKDNMMSIDDLIYYYKNVVHAPFIEPNESEYKIKLQCKHFGWGWNICEKYGKNYYFKLNYIIEVILNSNISKAEQWLIINELVKNTNIKD